MHRALPLVKGEHLYQSETEGHPILVGTPAWYDWLEPHAAFTFVDAAGTFTARKSLLRTKGSSWKAYRRRQGKLYRIDLGPSHALTLQRLAAAAGALAAKLGSGEPAEVAKTPSAASLLPSSPLALTVDPSLSLLQTKLSRPRSRSDLHLMLATRADPPLPIAKGSLRNNFRSCDRSWRDEKTRSFFLTTPYLSFPRWSIADV